MAQSSKPSTSTLASPNNFPMENAINSSNFRFCLTVRLPQPPLAMVDLGLELGNKRFLGQDTAWGEAFFLKSVSISII